MAAIRPASRCSAVPTHLSLMPAPGFALPASRWSRDNIVDFDVLFTHCHYDHILGMPFFAPLYKPNAHVTVWSGHLAGIMTTREMLKAFMRPPWFPVPLEICHANITCNDFRANDVLVPREGVTLRTGSLNHPGNCVGYRVEWDGRAVALISDTEHVPGVLDPNVLALIQDADLVIYDANYVDEEMERYRGWGHSTWQQAIRLCEAAGARRLALFHHDKGRTDAQLGAIERNAKKRFAGAFAARDGLTLRNLSAGSPRSNRGIQSDRARRPSGRRDFRREPRTAPQGNATPLRHARDDARACRPVRALSVSRRQLQFADQLLDERGVVLAAPAAVPVDQVDMRVDDADRRRLRAAEDRQRGKAEVGERRQAGRRRCGSMAAPASAAPLRRTGCR